MKALDSPIVRPVSRPFRSPRRLAAFGVALLAFALSPATPASAADAVLGLRPITPLVEEGGTLEIDVVLSLPQACRSATVELDVELRVLPSVQGVDPSDFSSVSIGGVESQSLPISYTFRGQGVSGRISARLELVTADDAVREPLEDALIDLRVEPEGNASVVCGQVELGVTLGSSRASVAIEDNDSSRGGRTLAGPENAPRRPLVAQGVTGLRLVLFEGLDGSVGGLFARLLDSDAEPVVPTQQVTSLEPGEAGFRPAIASLPDGGFYVVYVESNVLGERVVGRRLQTDGIFGPETILAPFTLDLVGEVTAASDRLGRISVTIEDDQDLVEPILLELTPDGDLLSSRAVSIPNGAKLAKTPLGDTAVVAVTAGGILVLRVLSRDGELGPTMEVDSGTDPLTPVVVASSRGFVVVWTRGSRGTVWGRVFGRGGQPKGDAFQIGASPIVDGESPALAVNNAGDFVVAWESDAPVVALRPDDPSRIARAAGTGSSIVSRSWNPQGEAANEESVVVESEDDSEPSDPDVSIDDEDVVTVVFERNDADGEAEEIAEIEIDEQIAPGECSGDAEALCITDGRYEVRAIWDDGESTGGEATAAALTTDTGSFWFFDADNVELVVKVLDACSLAGTEWVFAAGLTDLAVELTVTNVLTGVTQTYFNSLGAFQPIQDTGAFECEGDEVTALAAPGSWDELARAYPADGWSEVLSILAGGDGAPDVSVLERSAAAGGDALVLGDGRFEVRVDWSTASSFGEGVPAALTADTGVFSFFDPENLEIVIKVLDACGVNGNHWVFGGGLTDVEARITVTDTETSAVREYSNDLGVPFQPIRDTSAFPCK